MLLPGGSAGGAVHRHNEVAGLEPGLFGGTSGQCFLNKEALFAIGNLHADAHHVHGVLHHVQEQIVLLGGHILGVGIAQQLKELVQGLGLIGLIGNVVIEIVLQQLQGLGHRQGGGRGGEQNQGQQGGGQAGQVFLHSGSPFVRPGPFVN